MSRREGGGPTGVKARDGKAGKAREAQQASSTEAIEQAKARRRHPSTRTVDRQPGTGNPLFMGITFLVVVFNLLGLVMVLSASSVTAYDEYGSSWYFVNRQAIWATLGAAALFGVSRVDYHRWRRMARPLLWVGISALVAVLLVGTSHGGATRWLGWGTLTVQPAEMVKLALLVWVADLLARRSAWMHNTQATLRPVVVVLAVVSSLVMLQPNLGTTLVIVAIALSMCFVAGVPLAPLARWGAGAAGLATILALTEPYRRTRVLSFLDPMADPLGQGYQQAQSLVGLATGGVTGTGLGASRAKWGFLPLAHSDFIFSIVGEELGLVGALVVVALFVLFGVLGIRVALYAPDRFGMLLATGVTAWFLVQAFVNIGAVTGILPVTGVPLPFVSYGGSSLMFSMVGAGILLAVARQARPPAPASATAAEGSAKAPARKRTPKGGGGDG